MFTGEFEHSLDSKGRLILPAKFRGRLEQLFVTKGRDGCLYVLPPDEFNGIAERLKEAGGKARDMERVFFGGASEQTIDRQGRMLIPETLRRYAGLERDVSVVGVGPRVEIWNRDRWGQRQGEIDQQYAAFGEAHPDLPI